MTVGEVRSAALSHRSLAQGREALVQVSRLWLMAAKLSSPKATLKKQRFWLLHL